MKKLYSQHLQKTIILALLLFAFDNLEAQLKFRYLFGLVKPYACNIKPTIVCPANFSACPKASLDPSSTGYATGKAGGPNCSAPVITYHDDTISLGPCSGSIDLMRIWTATDPQDPLLNSSCVQMIKLSDNIKPVISNCPINITAQAGPNCKANVTWAAPTVTDNCGKLFLTVTHISGDAFPIGVTTVIYTAEDLCANLVTCSFTITVSGACCHTNPIITCPINYSGCPGDTILPDQTGKAIVLPGDASCSIPTFSYKDSVLTTGPCTGGIKLIRIWKAVDPYDATLYSTCLQTIELKDIVPPSLNNMPSNLTVNPGNDCKAIVMWTAPIATDACGIQSLSSSYPSGSSFNEGVNTIIYTANDFCGNTISKSFTITVASCCTNSPTIQCPLNFSSCPGTNTDPTTTGNALAVKGNPGCDTPFISYTDSVVNNTCPGAKMIYRKWKATDPNNTSLNSTCIQYIELKDIMPPVFTSCPSNITVYTNTIDCKAAVQWNTPTVTDNCGSTINLTSNFPSGSLFPVGVVTIIYNASDICGNTIQHSFTITVLNNCCNATPKIYCPANYNGCPIEHCGVNISGTASAEPGTPGCPIPIVSFRDSLLNLYSYCTNAKKFIRIWRATDPNDSKNYVECKQTIDLIDKTPPVWNFCPQDITVNAYGDCAKTVSWNPPTATDNCSSMVQISSNYYPGQSFPAGTTQIIYTAKDACGNTITHSFKITVIGSGLSITCPSDIVVERTDPQLPGAYVNWPHPNVTTCGSCKDTLKGFIYMGTYNGSKYYCSKTTETWSNARNICSSLGGFLAVINSSAENNFVASKLMGGTAFIGLHDSNIEGNFEWVNNEPVNFINWYPGQPNNANGDQDYVEMLPDGTWNDQYGNSYREFICEVPCYTLTQIEGPPCGSLFKCGSTRVTYVATEGNFKDTCSFNVTVKCNGNKYCDSYGQSCSYLWIKNVNICTINNTTGSNNGYAFFPYPCGELKWGNTYNICLTPGFFSNAYTVYWKVWIDYNGDGDFMDLDEFVAYGTGSSTICGNITLPWNCQCSVNNTRMRVSMSYSCYPGNSCSIFTYGEVEDYCINISKGNLKSDDVNGLAKKIDATEMFGQWSNQNDLEIRSIHSLDEGSEASLELLPNPATSILNISIAGVKNSNLRIINSEGIEIFKNQIESSLYQLDVSNWESGIYLAIMENENSQRIIKKFSIVH
ncbi:MAG: HYR domain-containing protein [Saprospiraceae bacterium]